METMLNIPLGRGAKYGTMAVDTTKFAQHVHDHVYLYGLRQILNDAIADKTDDDGKPLADSELVAKAQRRLDTLYSGELRVARASEPSDPVERYAARMAWEQITGVVKKFPEYAAAKGEKDRVMAALVARAKAAGKAEPTRDGVIAQWLAARPEITREAQRRAKEDAKLPTDLPVEL